MKINKGTIKHINKKLLVGTLVFALSATSLVGCGNSLRYEENKNGELVCVNEVKHEYVEDYRIVVFEIDGKQSIFITKAIESTEGKGFYRKQYYNIFGGQLIYDSLNKDSNLKIIEEEYLISYLVIYDKVKSEYTEDDLKEVLELIKNDYEKENNKELIKEK